MVYDNLGRICNAHVAHADRSDDGAMDPKCIQLAELAAIAVDSAKTGEIVRMPPSLSPKEYPDFMGKVDVISYRSEKILGRLYRSILGENGGDFVPQDMCISNEISYDTDLEIPGALSFLEDAWQYKCLYEAQLNTLLSQYGVHSEAELVTGEIWSLVGYNKKYQYKLKERLNYAYSKLHQEFRSIFESIDVSYGDNKNLAYEMKASAWYQVTYRPEFIRLGEPDDEKTPARLSFAWIAVDYLAEIKKKVSWRNES